MPTAPDTKIRTRLTSTKSLVTDPGSVAPSLSSAGSATTCVASTHGRRTPQWRAIDEDAKGNPHLDHVVCGITATADLNRWSLHLQATDSQEDWHLFRVDLAAPEDPPVDLTPLPQGSRVFTVDPLATVPGTVLVSMNQRPSLIDYFLIDVATGETTTYLPAGPAV